MKRTIGVLSVLMTLTTISMAQDKELKGFELSKESVVINVSADELWKIVGPGFEDAHLWATSVDHSTGTGDAQFEGATCDTRSCDLSAKGFDKVEERITKYDDQKMNLAYQITEGMPGFVVSASNDWTIVSAGPNQSKIIMQADFRVKGLMGSMMKGMMQKKIEKLIGVVLNDLQVYAETGAPSMSKQERMAEVAKKNKAA
jgi:preprotein translocase subunit SecD